MKSNETDLIVALRQLKLELHKLKDELLKDDPKNLAKAVHGIHFLKKELFSGHDTESGIIRRCDEVPPKEIHYNRNLLMPSGSLPGSPKAAISRGWDGSVSAACHQFTSPDRSNIKFVSPNGKLEVIYDSSGRTVTASEDYGTYNFADSRQDPVGHFYRDVLPWLFWGNDEMDSTDMRQRLKALVIYGGLDALPSVRPKHHSDKHHLPEEEIHLIREIKESISEGTAPADTNELLQNKLNI